MPLNSVIYYGWQRFVHFCSHRAQHTNHFINDLIINDNFITISKTAARRHALTVYD